MAEDIKKTILIDVNAKSDDLLKNSAALNATLDELKAKLKSVSDESGKNSVAYQEQASKIRLTQQAIRENNRELDNATKAFKAQTNSIDQNKALVATLTIELAKMSQAEGATSIKAMELESRLKSVRDTLQEQRKAYGDNTMNVGNYEAALGKLNTAHQTTSNGLQKLTGSITGTVGGFGFMPQALTDAGNSLSGFVDIQKGAIQGFLQHNAIIQENKVAQEALVIANEESAIAAKANEVAQERLAAGEITETEASLAATTAKEASVVATDAQTVATAASTAATEAGTTGLKLLRLALASTGIGLLIIALGSLVAYFESSNEGSKKFQVILAEINAVVQAGLKVFSAFGKTIFDAISHPIDSLKALGQMIVDNVLNRFKAISVILDGIIHLDFKKVSDGVIQSFTGVTNATDKIANMGKGIADFARNAKDAAVAAGAITVERQKLTKAEREWSEEKTKQQGVLDKLKLQIRDQGLAEKDRLVIAEKAKEVSDNIFKNNLEHAQKNAELVIKEQNLNSKKDFQAITDAKNRVQELKNAHEAEIQSIQNRESRVQKMVDRQGKAEESQKQKMAKALTEAENLKAQSLTRQLQAVYDNYGDEILAQDQHYNDELAKLKKLNDEKLITITKFNEVKEQLEAEHRANIQKVVEKFSKEDAAAI
ncbi:MAG: smc 2, partial [Bacteroidota bacterium]|nr:smc 2 [Bacteroidota bacterium]